MIDWLAAKWQEFGKVLVAVFLTLSMLLAVAGSRLDLVDYSKLALFAAFAAFAGFWLASKYDFPYPMVAAVLSALLGSPVLSGISSITIDFYKNPKSIIDRWRKK